MQFFKKPFFARTVNKISDTACICETLTRRRSADRPRHVDRFATTAIATVHLRGVEVRSGENSHLVVQRKKKKINNPWSRIVALCIKQFKARILAVGHACKNFAQVGSARWRNIPYSRRCLDVSFEIASGKSRAVVHTIFPFFLQATNGHTRCMLPGTGFN